MNTPFSSITIAGATFTSVDDEADVLASFSSTTRTDGKQEFGMDLADCLCAVLNNIPGHTCGAFEILSIAVKRMGEEDNYDRRANYEVGDNYKEVEQAERKLYQAAISLINARMDWIIKAEGR